MKSMTGFGRAEISQTRLRGSIEIKSWNNRYLDISISLPSWLSRLEPRFRAFLAERIVHGKVECSFRVRELDAPVSARADLSAARAVAGVLREIADAAGIEEPLRLGDLVGFEGVVAYERELDEDGIWNLVEPALARAFGDYEETRLREGAATRADIETSLARVEAGLDLVRDRLPEIERTVRAQVRARFTELLGEGLDEQRVLTEVASLLMKYTVNEEVARLSAHVESFRRIAAAGGAQAKKLDFLCQEMNREVNTIGSKNILLPVAEAVVELKDSLENIREQLRNVE